MNAIQTLPCTSLTYLPEGHVVRYHTPSGEATLRLDHHLLSNLPPGPIEGELQEYLSRVHLKRVELSVIKDVFSDADTVNCPQELVEKLSELRHHTRLLDTASELRLYLSHDVRARLDLLAHEEGLPIESLLCPLRLEMLPLALYTSNSLAEIGYILPDASVHIFVRQSINGNSYCTRFTWFKPDAIRPIHIPDAEILIRTARERVFRRQPELEVPALAPKVSLPGKLPFELTREDTEDKELMDILAKIGVIE